MKKLITFILLFSLFSSVFADLAPSYPSENILNVADYPERTFFQKMREPHVGGLEIIPRNGHFEANGCPIEIWAIKDAFKLNELVGVIYIYNYSLLERGAIKLANGDDFRVLDCGFLYNGNKIGKTNYITIVPELFRENTLSQNKVERLKTIVKNSYQRFKEKFSSNDLWEANINLRNKTDVLLRNEKRLDVIFALSYLKSLSSNSK